MAVDSLGMVWTLLVVPAGVQDRDGGRWLLALVRGLLARVREADYALALCRAYNDWLCDWCAIDRKRLKGVALVPLHVDVKGAIVEMERRLVPQCDLLVVTAQRLLDKWRSRERPTVLARNAADYDFYAQRCHPNNILTGVRPPVVGYYGAIAD